MTAPSRRATTSPLRTAGARLSCRRQPSQGLSTATSWSILRSVALTLPACFSLRATRAP